MIGAVSLVDFINTTQDEMRMGLVQKITNESVFLKLLRFIPVDGVAYEYAVQETLGGIAFRGFNGTYTPDTGVINPAKEVLGIFGGLIQTDRMLAMLKGGIARTNQILARVRKAGLFYDKYVIDGDPAVIEKSFYGLNARLVGNQLLYCNDDEGNGGNLSLKDVDKLIDSVVGPNENKVLVMNKLDRRALKQAALASGARWSSIDDVGKSMDAYDNVQIKVIDEDGDEAPILGHDETRGTATTTSSMYCIRPGQDAEGEYVQGLVGGKIIDHEDQGVRGTIYFDLVEMLGGLAVFHPRAAARLAGILPDATES